MLEKEHDGNKPVLRKEHCLSKAVRDVRKKEKSAFNDASYDPKLIDSLQRRAYESDRNMSKGEGKKVSKAQQNSGEVSN